jgi:hypothetical protein
VSGNEHEEGFHTVEVNGVPVGQDRARPNASSDIEAPSLAKRIDCNPLRNKPFAIEPEVAGDQCSRLDSRLALSEHELVDRSFRPPDRERPYDVQNTGGRCGI